MKIDTKNHTKRNVIITLILVLVIAATCAFIYQRNFAQTSQRTEETDHHSSEDMKTGQSGASGIDRGNTTVEEVDGDGHEDVAQKGISSNNGSITLYTPLEGSVMKDRSFISGISSYKTINFRLVDDRIGVLSTGSLKVIDGKFSGRVSLDSKGTNGKLDIFQEAKNGSESDLISIPVRYR